MEKRYKIDGMDDMDSKKKIVIIVIILLSLAIAGGVIVYKVFIPLKTYDDAINLISKHDYEKSLELLGRLPHNGDYQEKINKAKYIIASDLVKSKEFKKALAVYTDLKDYKDSNEKATLLKNNNIKGTLFASVKSDGNLQITITSNIQDDSLIAVTINDKTNDTLPAINDWLAVTAGKAEKNYSVPKEWGTCEIRVTASLKFDPNNPQPQKTTELYGANGQNLWGSLVDIKDGYPVANFYDCTVPYPSQDLYDQYKLEQEKAAYAAECNVYEYRVLNRDAVQLKGQKVKQRGKIFQILKSQGSTSILLSVTDRGYGYWTDNVAISGDNNVDYYEGDIITVYGTIDGAYSYESVAGYNITVPLIKGAYYSN